MSEADKENLEINNPQENPEWSKLLDLKNEVAQAYIDKIKEWWLSFSWLIIWKWDMLKDYLVTEDIFDKIADEAKWKFLFQPFIKPLLSETIQYNWKTITIWEYLEQAKKELDNAHTEIELNNLKSKIIDKPDLADQTSADPSKQQEQADNVVPKDEIDNKTDNWSNFEKLTIWTLWAIVISQVEIDYVNNERSKIEKNIEIKWDFANIKKIEDSQWNKILESKWESPYIHKDAIKDLIWFSLLFYKKTWDELTLESAYRNIEHQKRLKKKKPKLAAEPGKSWHNLWLSIDITESDRYSKKIWGVQWLREMAAKFNFNPLNWEDWHFDYWKLPDAADRLQLAQNLDKEFNDLKLAA